MGVYQKIVFRVWLAAASAVASANANARVRRPVSRQRPLILLPSTRKGAAETLANIKPSLRPFVALQVGGMYRRARMDRLEAICEKAQAAGVPLVLHVRTHFPIENEEDYDGKVMALDIMKEYLNRYKNIIGVIVAEQYAFTAEQREYLRHVLELTRRRGVYCLLDAGWHAGASWDELGFDAALWDEVLRSRATFVPMWEMNVSEGMLTEHAQLMGLWLSGRCDCWGANPQTWLWGEAGFGDVNQVFGWRGAGTGGMKKVAELRRFFPLYGQTVLMPAVTGASVFWIGGERPPHAWDSQGNPSHFWRDTLEPVFEAIVKHGLIASRDDVRASVRLMATNPRGLPYVWDDAVSHSSRCSARIACGAGRSIHLAWASDRYLRLCSDTPYVLSGWVRTRRLRGEASLCVSWLGQTRWKHFSSSRVQGDQNWRPLRAEFRAKPPMRFVQVRLEAEACGGDVWFDDVSLTVANRGADVLLNGGFEQPRRGGFRPLGWRPAGGYGSPERQECQRGINAVWHALYGVRHRAEFLPNAGEWFPVIAWPPRATTRSDWPRHMLDVSSLDDPRSVSQVLGVRASTPEAGFAAVIGNTLLAFNSHENLDARQTLAARLGRVDVGGQLPVHHYVLLKELKANAEWLALIGGRPGGRMELVLRFGRPVAMRVGSDAVKGVPSAGRTTWKLTGQFERPRVAEIAFTSTQTPDRVVNP